MLMFLPLIILTFSKKNVYTLIMSLSMLSLILTMNFQSNIPFYWFCSKDLIASPLILLTFYIVILIMISSPNFYNMFMTMMTSLFILCSTFMTTDLLLFYIQFELCIIPIFMIIMNNGEQKERLQASSYIIMYTVTASLPLLFSILSTKTPDFTLAYFSNSSFYLPLFLLLAFLVKSPMYLTHLWLPKAHVEAPMEGSMILAAILLKLGGVGLLRMIPLCYKSLYTLNPILISISLMGALLTATSSTRQKDLKALIAYSSVTHMSLMILTLLMFNLSSASAAMMMMISHGLCSSALFMLITMNYKKKHTRNSLSIKGTINKNPNLNKWMFMFLMINMSAPLTLNLLSEIFIISSITMMHLNILWILFLALILTASYNIILYTMTSNSQIQPNPSKITMYSKHYMMAFMHFFPLILLILKPDILYNY